MESIREGEVAMPSGSHPEPSRKEHRLSKNQAGRIKTSPTTT
jgi:hypothetical protein